MIDDLFLQNIPNLANVSVGSMLFQGSIPLRKSSV